MLATTKIRAVNRYSLKNSRALYSKANKNVHGLELFRAIFTLLMKKAPDWTLHSLNRI